jgi:predicted ATPase with chaperone activity
MNPCPCGYHGDPRRDCTCAASAVDRYQATYADPNDLEAEVKTCTARRDRTRGMGRAEDGMSGK